MALVRAAEFDGLREPCVLGLGQAACVDRQQHIGGAVGALGRQALVEARGGIDHVGLDAGLGGERLEQRVDQLRLAVGVDVHLLGGGRSNAACESGQSESDACLRACQGVPFVRLASCPPIGGLW